MGAVNLPPGQFPQNPAGEQRDPHAAPGDTIYAEDVQQSIQENGFIITSNKFEGALKGKEITVYTAKVLLRTREGVPFLFELKGGTGLNREGMIKLVKTVQYYASHISAVDIDKLIEGKTFGLNMNIEGAEGKVGLMAWVPEKGIMMHVAATSQWYGAAPSATLHSTTEEKKFYYFVYDLNQISPPLPGEEDDMGTVLKRGAYRAISGLMKGAGAGMLKGMFDGISTQQDVVDRAKAIWEDVHGKGDSVQQGIERNFVRNAAAEMEAAITKASTIDTDLEPEELRNKIGELTLAFYAKRDHLKHMSEAQYPTLKQKLLVPSQINPERADQLLKYGASDVQQKVVRDLFAIRHQIRALQSQLAATEIAKLGDINDKYPELGPQLAAAGALQGQWINEVIALQAQIDAEERKGVTSRTPGLLASLRADRSTLVKKLDMLEKVQRQRALFVEVALASDELKERFFGDAVLAKARLDGLNGIIEALRADAPNFVNLKRDLETNRLSTLEIQEGMAKGLAKGRGLATGTFEKELGIDARDLWEAYTPGTEVQQRIEVERMALEGVPELPDADLDDPDLLQSLDRAIVAREGDDQPYRMAQLDLLQRQRALVALGPDSPGFEARRQILNKMRLGILTGPREGREARNEALIELVDNYTGLLDRVNALPDSAAKTDLQDRVVARLEHIADRLTLSSRDVLPKIRERQRTYGLLHGPNNPKKAYEGLNAECVALA